ncbi:MAG: M50 family metallopeptidase [Candidatus Saccharibacteria bacterium]
MTSILLLIVGILLFIGLVVAHEFGHFLMARRNGVDVEEFGIFFPPRLFKYKTKAGWNFTINALPLGGFVKLKGEHDSDVEPGSFGAASLLAKSKIMAAGVVMNLIVALVMLTALALIGMPKLVPNQFTVKSDTKISRQEVLASYVEPGSPAAKAGLSVQDQITQVGPNADHVATSAELVKLTKQYAGQTIPLSYNHAGQAKHTQAKIRTTSEVEASKKTDNPKGYLGVAPVEYSLQRSTWSAPVVAVGFSAQLTQLTFQGLGHALGGLGSIFAGAATGNATARQHGQTSAASQVSGPVGIFVVLKDGSLLGYQFMLLIIAVISLTLAIMNILPIPALDGGRLWITLITRALHRPLSPKREEAINLAGFATLMLLIIAITVVDIRRFF